MEVDQKFFDLLQHRPGSPLRQPGQMLGEINMVVSISNRLLVRAEGKESRGCFSRNKVSYLLAE